MPDDLGHVRRGQEIAVSARTWNAFIDAARAHQAGGGQSRGGKPASGGAFVQVLNDSGSARERHDILGIFGPLFDPDDTSEDVFAANRVLKGDTPDVDAHYGFAVLQCPAADGVCAPAVVSGVTMCRVYMTDADHICARMKDGDNTRLESCVSGPAKILWSQTPSSPPEEVLAVVQIGVATRRVITARISGSTAIAAANNGPGSSTTEWTYSIVEVEPTVSSGDQSWSDVSGGVSLTDKAFNRLEYGNRNVGTGEVFGCGIAFDDLDDSDTWDAELLPASDDAGIVEVELITVSGTIYGLFKYHNQATGECAE
jgi:hypothetical protein